MCIWCKSGVKAAANSLITPMSRLLQNASCINEQDFKLTKMNYDFVCHAAATILSLLHPSSVPRPPQRPSAPEHAACMADWLAAFGFTTQSLVTAAVPSLSLSLDPIKHRAVRNNEAERFPALCRIHLRQTPEFQLGPFKVLSKTDTALFTPPHRSTPAST